MNLSLQIRDAKNSLNTFIDWFIEVSVMSGFGGILNSLSQSESVDISDSLTERINKRKIQGS